MIENGRDGVVPCGRDRGEIEKGLRSYERLLRAWLEKKFGDRELAQDLAQEACLRVWQYAEHNEVGSVKPLLFKTAANLAANEFRSRGRMRASGLTGGTSDAMMEVVPCDSPSPERATVARADAMTSLQAIRALPEKQRRAFIMNRFENLSYQDIASNLGVSVSSVEKYMMAALSALRQAVDEDTGGKVVPLHRRREKAHS